MNIHIARRFIVLLLAVSSFGLAGCATFPGGTSHAQRAAMQAVFAEHARLKIQDANGSILSDEHMANLAAIEVRGCPQDFQSAWFDYLVQARNLHRRAVRAALWSTAAGKPVVHLPELIRVAASSPVLGQYLSEALNQDDLAWEKLERSALGHGVVPKP